MKDARELLVKLRAAGVEPMTEDRLGPLAVDLAEGVGRRFVTAKSAGRLLASLLEARAKLAEVREWAEAEVAKDPPPRDVQAIGRANAARDLLVRLDREPEP